MLAAPLHSALLPRQTSRLYCLTLCQRTVATLWPVLGPVVPGMLCISYKCSVHELTPFCKPCSRTVGYRFAAQLPRAVPLIIRHCGQASEEDDELREACLQALEAFVMRSAHETRPFLDQVSLASPARFVLASAGLDSPDCAASPSDKLSACTVTELPAL